MADRQTKQFPFDIIDYRGTYTFLFTLNKALGTFCNWSLRMGVAQRAMDAGGIVNCQYQMGDKRNQTDMPINRAILFSFKQHHIWIL